MRVVIRVDVHTETGTGHLARCLTLASAIKAAGGRVTFVCRHLPEPLEALITRQGIALERLRGRPLASDSDLPHSDWLRTTRQADADDTIRVLDKLSDGCDWMVVDHYALDARWESRVRGTARVLVIDDLADRNHDANLLVDQNLHPDGDARYATCVAADCRLLTGPRFALIRDEFVAARGRVGPRGGPVTRVLVCFGGIDKANHTRHAIAALAASPPFVGGVDVVVGATHADRDGIAAQCTALGFRCHIQPNGMAMLMAAADLAIGAGGITTWERCTVGLPALVTPAADNQVVQIKHAAAAGLVCAPDTGEWYASLNAHLGTLRHNAAARESLSRRGLDTVDGRGVSRVLRAMGLTGVTMRAATYDDTMALLSWRNAPEVRRASRANVVIDLPEHRRWLEAVLQDPKRVLLIGEQAGAPIGVVRFDITGSEAEVSIYLSPGKHPAGTGSALLAEAERSLAITHPDVRRFRAQVLGDNRSSHGLFKEGGYGRTSTWYDKDMTAQ